MQNIRNEMLLEQAFLDPKHFRVTGVRCYIDGKPGAPQETPGRSLGASAAYAKTVQIVTEVLNSAPLVALSDFVDKGISLRTARTELLLRVNHGLVKVVDTKVRRKKLYGWAKK